MTAPEPAAAHPDLAGLRPTLDPATEAAVTAAYERIRAAAQHMPTRELLDLADRELEQLAAAGIYHPDDDEDDTP